MQIDEKIFNEIQVIPASEYQIIIPTYGEYMQTQYNQDDRNIIYGLFTNQQYSAYQLNKNGENIHDKFEAIKTKFDNQTKPAVGFLSQNSFLYDALLMFDKENPGALNWNNLMDWQAINREFFKNEFGLDLVNDSPLYDESLIIFYNSFEDIDHYQTLFNDYRNTVPKFIEFINE